MFVSRSVDRSGSGNCVGGGGGGGLVGGEGTYAVIDHVLIASIVVDVDGDAAEGGDFGGEFGEAGVVLSVWVEGGRV